MAAVDEATPSRITGDLTGDLTLKMDSGENGGRLDLLIEGDVAAGSSIVADTIGWAI